jgi:hypothetical protein
MSTRDNLFVLPWSGKSQHHKKIGLSARLQDVRPEVDETFEKFPT